MKNSLFFLVLLLITTSCTKSEMEDATLLIGIWERTSSTEISSSVDRLVFKSDYSGIKINTINHKSGEVISNASSFKWNLSDESVVLSSEDNSPFATYVLDSEEELKLSSIDEMPYIKVSDTVLNY
ncbi:hypothetical protein OE09_1979 [Flavobacteriaceae bacterium MAR_2010_72]|nr:hypothetical protein OE09_1979 [Flavobacteriaceae bacterium MAR_2010_72]TVZ59310.1 hypothetical protein NA63_1838 [Flavobacteriaceae bacterium MAR_2010_105]